MLGFTITLLVVGLSLILFVFVFAVLEHVYLQALVWSGKGKPRKRRKLLRMLEGWYNNQNRRSPQFKFSCRFHDILRCSEFNGRKRHFISCFAKNNVHKDQPFLRTLDPSWAIVYVPDKHGNFIGRFFVRLVYFPWPTLTMYRTYGDRISRKITTEQLRQFHFWTRLIVVRNSSTDVYLKSKKNNWHY